jgi:glutathione synthase/RimK-type ligase-like ATP-grasp enzyme
MKIAIQHKQGSFSERWIEYCEKNDIEYKIVDAYKSDIINQIEDCTVFMWHHYSDSDYRDYLFASQLLFSLEMKGMKVFPNFNTTWHFNDKVGQKYLLEAIGAPLVPSYVFYTRKEALEWINRTDFPKVFKLRSGAGSGNVKLARTQSQAKKLTFKAFNSGFSQLNRIEYFKDNLRKWRLGNDKLGLIKGIVRLIISSKYSRMLSKEKGYIYFQDFIPNNNFDIRVVVIGDKAFALKRLVRKGDFRASGGGNIVYDKNQIDERCVKIAFEVNDKIKSQSIAYDFVFDKDNNPLIIEISYGYAMKAYDNCEGYWDKDLNWYKGINFDFCGWVVENL